MKRYFITGERECGKSTLLKNIVKECRLDIEGFTTFFDHTENRLYLQIINHRTRSLIAERNKYGYMKAKRDKLLKVSQAINRSFTNKKTLIIDELGYIEQQSTQFMNIIENVLKNAKEGICVIRKDDNTFLKRIKQLPDYETIFLTCDNREAIKRRLKRVFCK
ncbi:MAG: nucleoside-triphosphatase [Thermotogota bacterium]|nr:nucleoside-triphosphatase [Thermotogota bacterium]